MESLDLLCLVRYSLSEHVKISLDCFCSLLCFVVGDEVEYCYFAGWMFPICSETVGIFVSRQSCLSWVN